MTFTYKELIDVAIGSPESGHVNFYALHVLLTCFGQRLEVLDEVVEQDDYMVANVRLQSSMLNLAKSSKFRLVGGTDVEVAKPDPEAGEEEHPAEEAATIEPVPVEEADTENLAPIEEAGAVDLVPAEEVDPGDVTNPPAQEIDLVPAEEVDTGVPIEEAGPIDQVPVEAAVSGDLAPVEELGPGETVPVDGATAPSGPASQQMSAQQSEHASRHLSEDKLDTKSEKERKSPETSVPASRASLHSNARADGSAGSNVMRLERRISRMELQKEQSSMEVQQFMNNLTGQLKLTMEQVNNMTHLLIDRKPNPERIKVLRAIAKQLRVLMATSCDEVSISWTSEEIVGVGEEEGFVEEEQLKESSTIVSSEKPEEDQDLGLEPTICYNPDKMLTEVLELKSQFCDLSNKVNDLASALLKQDSQRLMDMINDLQEQMRDIKEFMASSRDQSAGMTTRLNDAVAQISLLKKSTAHLDDVKIDKVEVELLLAEKVDFQQLATKVSLEQLDEYKARLEKLFCEVRHIINLNEKNVLQIIDNLRMTLGVDALELSLKDFREVIEKRVHMIAEALQKYMEMTNDDCAAAAGRVKVMQDLSCLACDTTCVMRTVERSKVPSLPNAKASSGLGPIVTYELGQIRKSGIMGYYRKDEFPHSTSAWAKGTGVPMVKCTPRHAGGSHTTHTANEHMQKVVLSKKTSGWK